MKRDIYTVGPKRKSEIFFLPWVLMFNSSFVADFQTQAAAIDHAAKLARQRLAETGWLA